MKIKPVVRPFAPQEWKIYKDLRLRALADSPDAFGRTLAEEKSRTDDIWRKRINEGAVSGRDLPLLAELDGEPIGLAWGHFEETDPGIAHLYQVWVAPAFRRLGLGQMMLEAVVSWAKEKNTKRLELNVTCGDGSAMRLYVRAGFKPSGRREILRPGSELMSQEMRLDLV